MQQRSRFRVSVLGLLGALALTPLVGLWAVANPSPVQAAPVEYAALLTGPAESPPVPSPGVGNARVELDTVAHRLRVRVQFSGLLGTTTSAHIHAPTAAPGAGTAGVATQVPFFTGFPIGVTSGTYDQTFDTTLVSSWNPSYIAANGGTPASTEAALDAALAAGKAYLNVHSSLYGGGEIRGFLTPPVVGGKNLEISTGSVDLSWDGGNVQSDYIVARAELIPAGPTTFSAPLPATSTSYTDAAPPASTLLCYQVVPRNGAGTVLGLSDFDCAFTGFAGGTVIPGDFTLGLNQSTTASLTWTVPAGGPVDGYALYKLPFDGSPITFEVLGAGATSSVQNMGATHYCYTLVAFRGAAFGNTNLVCGIQGFSTLSQTVNGTVSVGATMDGLQQTLGDLGSTLGALREQVGSPQ